MNILIQVCHKQVIFFSTTLINGILNPIWSIKKLVLRAHFIQDTTEFFLII